MPSIDYKRLSKTTSHALRHAPHLYNLTLDEAGWTPLPDLIAALQKHRRVWRSLTPADMQAMVAQPGKKRFEIKGGRIRAYYGHSLSARIEKTPAEPPLYLYHGTTPQAAQKIRREGLRPMRRQYVHLSTDANTAGFVGQRRVDEPVILTIKATAAGRAGVQFYLGNEDVWLADHVPPQFIE